MNLEYNKAIGGEVLVASAAILLAGCTINIGGGSPEAEANDSVTGANSSQIIEMPQMAPAILMAGQITILRADACRNLGNLLWWEIRLMPLTPARKPRVNFTKAWA